MLDDCVTQYIKKNSSKPFFYVVGNEEYDNACDDLKAYGFKIKSICDYCSSQDKFPNLDRLINDLQTADVNFSSNKYAVVGLGEYLVLLGNGRGKDILRKLWDTLLGSAHVVLVLRYISKQLNEFLDSDFRFRGQNRVCIRGNDFKLPTIINVNRKISNKFVRVPGIVYLLHQLELSNDENIYFTSELDLSDAIIRNDDLTDSFSALGLLTESISLLCKANGSDLQWDKLLDEVIKYDSSIQNVFQHYRLNDDIDELETDLLEIVFKGEEYRRWLYFIVLKMNIDHIKNVYLKRVIKHSIDVVSFKNKVIDEIISVPNTNKDFKSLYTARKKLLRGVSSEDMDEFVNQECVKDPAIGLYCLTDNTLLEREAIVRWISDYSDNSIVSKNYYEVIKDIYPDLASYMKEYIFNCGNLSSDLTYYFNRYKVQKLQNKIDDDFLEIVPDYASKYARLDSRANVLLSISDKDSSYLYWIDALGVEYLSFILDLASQHNLSVHVDIARADLPTITMVNKSFYENWEGPEKYKEEELDKNKHKKNSRYNYENCKAPIHLALELDIIRKALKHAEDQLNKGYKKFIIASDHGASRLAVICENELPYDTDTRGEHSGRCCKSFEGSDELCNAIDENGYTVLTDYGRFKGSRKANVEVHGGGSLEETVVPVITLTLKKHKMYNVELPTGEIKVDIKSGITFELHITGVDRNEKVEIKVRKNTVYFDIVVSQSSPTLYRVKCSDIKRSGEYKADIYIDGEEISSITLDVKGATGSSKSKFDDLFR